MNTRGGLGVLAVLSASACGMLVGDYGVGTGAATDSGVDQHSGSSSGSSSGGGGVCVKASPGTCGLSPQCGCTANQTCQVTDAMGTAGCVAAGSGPQGHGCNTTADCAAGLTCLAGACRPYCPAASANSQCGIPGTGLCIQVVNDATGTNVPNETVCLINCALDDPTSCGGIPASGPIAGCVLDTNGGTNTDCQAAGSSMTSTCSGSTAPPLCAPGYGCQQLGSGLVCAQWCRLDIAGTCQGGATCMQFGGSGGVIINGTAYGYCP
jgi:hypothetical protein